MMGGREGGRGVEVDGRREWRGKGLEGEERLQVLGEKDEGSREGWGWEQEWKGEREGEEEMEGEERSFRSQEGKGWAGVGKVDGGGGI